jgi:hypothetical protein
MTAGGGNDMERRVQCVNAHKEVCGRMYVLLGALGLVLYAALCS